mgnify:CR=1 FL=1
MDGKLLVVQACFGAQAQKEKNNLKNSKLIR